MEFHEVMQELENLGKVRTKSIYLSNGAKEPLFGVNTGDMKPMSRKIKINQRLAEELYATNNYDAMYFAGVIADPNAMTEADYDRWIEKAYFYMISDFVVAVTLSESDIAQKVADKWIMSKEELKMSAGYSCYCWLLGNRIDNEFDVEKIDKMLDIVRDEIHNSPNRAKFAMNYFVYVVGVSYLPLHKKALEIAKEIGTVEITREKKKPQILNAYENILRDIDKGRIGFKRKYVRC